MTNASVFTSVIDAGRRPAPPPPPGMRIPGRYVFTWNLAYEEIYTPYGLGQGDANAIAKNKLDIVDAQKHQHRRILAGFYKSLGSDELGVEYV